jgi:hypothetical protein
MLACQPNTQLPVRGLHPELQIPANARRVDRLSYSPLPTAGFTTAALSAPEPEVTPAHDELAVRATLDGVVMIAA